MTTGAKQGCIAESCRKREMGGRKGGREGGKKGGLTLSAVATGAKEGCIAESWRKREIAA